MEDSEWKKYGAELFGTFALVFIGCGSAVLAGEYIGFLGISFAFGLVLMAMIYTIGSISGCHINPAVTIAMYVNDKINSRDALGYIAFQCIGAIIGAGLLLGIAVGHPDYSIMDNGLGQNGYGDQSPAGFNAAACIIAEVVLTAIFILVIFGATKKSAPEGFAGLNIGLTLAFIHIVGIPITGTSVNPARSLGPAVFVGGDAMIQLWMFWFAPIMGAVVGAFIWKFFLEEE
jgi:aquaporin Z